jgi:hypothetical protein
VTPTLPSDIYRRAFKICLNIIYKLCSYFRENIPVLNYKDKQVKYVYSENLTKYIKIHYNGKVSKTPAASVAR